MKVFLIIWFVGFHFPVSHAQGIQDKWNFGLVTSLDITTVSRSGGMSDASVFSQEAYKRCPQIGYKAGLVTRYNLSPRIFVSSQLAYVTDKTKAEVSLLDQVARLEETERYSWIELPVVVNYVLNPKSRYKVYTGLGPSLRRLLRSTWDGKMLRVDGTGTVIEGPLVSSYGQRYHWNLSANAVVGLELRVSEASKLMVSFSIERTLLKMIRPPAQASQQFDYEYISTDQKLNTFALNLSYIGSFR